MPGVAIKAAHITELRNTVNAARGVAGKPSATFTDDPPVRVKAVHITELRAALDEARSAEGFPAVAYTDPLLAAGTTVKAVHIQQLRDAARVVVDGCQAITVSNPIKTTFTNGNAVVESFGQSGAKNGATFSLDSGSLPNGLGLSSNGSLTGIPTQNGSFPITVKATDFYGCSGTGSTYALTIVPPPAILSFTADTSDFPGDSVTLTPTFSGGSGVISNNLDSQTISVTSGSNYVVNPADDITYTLTVTNAAGTSIAATASVVVPAVVRINEFNANISAGCDLIELRVVSGGNMSSFRIQERTGNVPGGELNFTFPSFHVAKNAIIVVHLNGSSATCNPGGATQELFSPAEQLMATFAMNFDSAYDFYATDTGLSATDNVFTLFNTNGTMIEAVFASNDPAGTSVAAATLSAAGAAGAANQWTPAQSSYTAVEFRTNAVDDLDATPFNRTGSIQRINNADTNSKSDWTTGAGAASSWGSPNAGQVPF